MPPVASDATSHALKPVLPNPARAAQTSDRAEDSPFESLLDAGASADGAQPPQTPAPYGDKAGSKASPNLIQPQTTVLTQPQVNVANAIQLDGTTEQPDADANPVIPNIAALIVASASDSKPVGAVKASTGTKTPPTGGEGAKAADDGKPTDGLAIADPANGLASNPLQTAVPGAAVAPVPTAITPDAAPQSVSTAIPPAALESIGQPAPAPIQQIVPDGVEQALSGSVSKASSDEIAQAVAAAVPQAVSTIKGAAAATVAAPKAKPVKLTAPQTESNEPADVSDSPVKTASAPKDDSKSQPVIDDSDKQGIARAHTDSSGDANHAAVAKAPAAGVPDTQPDAPKANTDAAQQIALTPPSPAALPANANPAIPAPPAAPVAVPLAGIAVEIAGKALAGKNRFEIRLDPPELGRIEVRLDVGHDGQVTSSLIADRSDTLDLLRRDAAGLERALQDAGLKTGDNGLQFSLRDQSMGRDQGQAPSPAVARLVVSDNTLTATDANPRNYGRLAGLGRGIDIRV